MFRGMDARDLKPISQDGIHRQSASVGSGGGKGAGRGPLGVVSAS